mgnify:FL=1
MDLQTLLDQQRQLYSTLLDTSPNIAIHPISGEWQTTSYLKTQFWWGGGATEESCKQLEKGCCQKPNLTHMGAITFGPVQEFLGGGQRLRDWAVASWLCHYLSAVFIHRWEERGGSILLPLHLDAPLSSWLQGEEKVDAEPFWQAEFPNVFTGVFPEEVDWFEKAKQIISEEWQRFVRELEKSAIAYNKLFDGHGWKVIHQDHKHLWSVYGASAPLNSNLTSLADSLHKKIDGNKLGRNWQKQWWGGRTSPTAGQLSIWHPGLLPVNQGGTWGLPEDTLKQWWEKLAGDSSLAGLFSNSDRLNSIEMVKRLASVPDIIVPTLERLWGRKPPACPWGKFPDRTAVAAAWIPREISPEPWNEQLQFVSEMLYSRSPSYTWGMPQLDKGVEYAHPRLLERRNILEEGLELWEEAVPKGWESAIEWTVGWRGDGDKIGEWLSGKQYETKRLPWQKWHLSEEQIQVQNLDIEPPTVPNSSRRLDLPHLLDLSVLFRHWNQLLYHLSERVYNSKVIFAGGDDFLVIGPITDTIPLTSQLHQLWLGKESDLTQPLEHPQDGWSEYEGDAYPIPGEKMSFS